MRRFGWAGPPSPRHSSGAKPGTITTVEKKSTNPGQEIVPIKRLADVMQPGHWDTRN